MQDIVFMTTADFLAALRKHLKSLNLNDTDYRLAKVLGVSPQTVSGWKTGKHTIDDKICLKVAELLQLEEGYVIACMYLERSKTEPVRQFWKDLAQMVADSHYAKYANTMPINKLRTFSNFRNSDERSLFTQNHACARLTVHQFSYNIYLWTLGKSIGESYAKSR